ncbi:MAG TPA: response regulator, partial [Anaeromyxobacter sp.]|nr:response regulator [Anaeromyxobacter sp.]
MPKNLLLADDSITIQKVVGITFASEDFKVTVVDNGEDAVSRARELKPDVILADVVMPRKNGYEVCEAVKTDPSLKHIPVLLLSGTFEAFDESRARQAKADGHIAKPFESGALINKVKELVGGAPAALAARPAAPAVAAAARPAAPSPVAAARPMGAPAGAPVAPRPAPGAPPAGARPGAPIPPGARPPGPGMPPGAPRPGA